MKVRIIYPSDRYIDFLRKMVLKNEDCVWNVKEVKTELYLLDVPVYSHGYWEIITNCDVVEEIPSFNEELERILDI